MADIARDAGIIADEPVLIGASKLFSHLWGVAWEHAAGTAGGDADALHDMRVALRRLRTTLQNFEGPKDAPLVASHLRRELAKERKRLGKLGDALGAVRDHDVLDEYLTDYAAKRLKRPISEAPGRAHLERCLQTERAAAFAPMVKRINRSREPGGLQEEFARFALGLPAAAASNAAAPGGGAPGGGAPGGGAPPSLQEAARSILAWRIDEVLSRAAALDDAHDDVGHHELRRALRRVRYTLETLATCFKQPVQPHVKTLVQLQDYLGEMQDRAVLRDTAYKAFGVTGNKGNADRDARRGAGRGEVSSPAAVRHASLPEDVAAFLKYGEGRRHRLLSQTRALWGEQEEKGFFATLRAL